MKKIIILSVFTLFLFGSLVAQSLKIAYIDSERIMTESKDTREAQNLFQKDRDGWMRQIEDLDAEIQRLENDYNTRKLTLSASGKKQAEDKIEEKKNARRDLVESIFGETGRAQMRNAELLQPIMTKLRNIIDRISVEENYAMVFDASSAGIIWAQPRLDITEQIIFEMNKTE
ncbi:MAG: OmpH family outer membrane protein [Candidatus Cloacimonadales bacterium]|nr:OmpH family outer membrane protein [Candidatus Cloacimonadota bacterium]MDD2650932.1 OmpH family outer membrane protein [Candidatus Cloacimonadota bacterium]MDX9976974.1 OmpH family outer membrane protein [Candidatus Cloacimonadales bacterium]